MFSPRVFWELRALRCPHVTIESVYDEELPTGDYQCVACGARFDSLRELRAARAGACILNYRLSGRDDLDEDAATPRVPA